MQRIFSRTLSVAQSGLRRLGRDERGSVLAYVVVVPVLAGALAIGVETGSLYITKHKMQSATDAAALAASVDLIANSNNTTGAAADARYETQRNGFTNGANNVSVAVNIPPTSGPNMANQNAVEVIATKTQTLSFGSVLNSWVGARECAALRQAGQGQGGSGATCAQTSSAYTLTARSVVVPIASTTSTTATTTSVSSVGCIVALTPNNEQGVTFSSFNNFNGDCTIMTNSTANGTTPGTASVGLSNFNNATLKSIYTKGSFAAASYNHLTLTTAAQTGQATSVVDPYSSLATPSPGTCTYTNYVEPSGNNLTLSPGTYCGGLSVVNKSNVYFTAGTYYVSNGDLVIRSDNNVSCSNCTNGAGVTFVLTQTSGNNSDIGGVSITSENNVTLSAPSSGTYAGIVFYQDRRATAGTMASTSKIFTLSSLNNATLSGAIYFPNNAINISSINNTGSNSTTGCSVWIGRYINFSSYNNNWIAGCSAYNTTPAGIATTTTTTTTQTVTKGKLVE
jgi:Flp pilus assembly protein TadG